MNVLTLVEKLSLTVFCGEERLSIAFAGLCFFYLCSFVGLF